MYDDVRLRSRYKYVCLTCTVVEAVCKVDGTASDHRTPLWCASFILRYARSAQRSVQYSCSVLVTSSTISSFCRWRLVKVFALSTSVKDLQPGRRPRQLWLVVQSWRKSGE